MSELMLAGKATDLGALRFPILASPKLDGIRATIGGKGDLYSRNGKLLPNKWVQEIGYPHLAGLDGELICGEPTAPDCFRKTSSAVMSIEGDESGKQTASQPGAVILEPADLKYMQN